MTNYDEMPAGREMNDAVAHRVMGWEFHANAGWYTPGMWEFNPARRAAPCDWSPSTDIAAAWEVVEKLDDGNLIFSLLRYGAGWRVGFMDDGNMRGSASGDTAPLAICRAALKAVR